MEKKAKNGINILSFAFFYKKASWFMPIQFYFVNLLRNIDNASTIDRQKQDLRDHRPEELLQFGGVCLQGTRPADDQPCRG